MVAQGARDGRVRDAQMVGNVLDRNFFYTRRLHGWAERQALAITTSSSGADWISGLATSRTSCLSASSVMYSTGDLPSTRARNRAGNSRAARASICVGASQST